MEKVTLSTPAAADAAVTQASMTSPKDVSLVGAALALTAMIPVMGALGGSAAQAAIGMGIAAVATDRLLQAFGSEFVRPICKRVCGTAAAGERCKVEAIRKNAYGCQRVDDSDFPSRSA